MRFVLRSDTGFLAARHTGDGPPIHTVADARDAQVFVDYATAVHRARALHQLGWPSLRIIETLIV